MLLCLERIEQGSSTNGKSLDRFFFSFFPLSLEMLSSSLLYYFLFAHTVALVFLARHSVSSSFVN